MIKIQSASDRDVFGDLDVFKSPGAKLSKRFVTILSRGGLLFSSGFVHEENIKNFTHIIMAYSRRTRAIGFSLTMDGTVPGAIKITHRSNSFIQAGSFFTFYRLNLAELTGRYEPEKQNLGRGRGEWYLIFLDKKLQK